MSNQRGQSSCRGGGKRRSCNHFLYGMSLVALLACNSAWAATEPAKTAGFNQQSASSEVRHVANWVNDAGDNGRMPYLIVDKVNARVFVFDASGHFQGAEPALLGMAVGDGSVAGIGDRKMSSIREQERTTPAGRFVASLSRDPQGKQVLVIDYAASIALHAVVKGQPAERRAQRLESATSKDNRISFGCINVPAKFFEKIVTPAFTNTSGLVYILPESGKASELFGSYNVTAGVGKHGSAQP